MAHASDADIDYKIITNKSKLPYLSPDLKERKTLKIRLENGLEAYLISAPNADQSGAMLSVKTGSWEDPANYPGLAHFVEHMLFMGTLKYPKESEYQKFITNHGGMANAFTSSNTTNFVFTVSNNVFQEALGRFSSFFKEPLFNPSGISRERQAVDQEYAKNLEQDNIRQLFVLKELADPRHPFSGFNMGNNQTLKSATRNDLEEWFQKHYSANLMKLVVFSPLPIDQIIELVVNDFAGITDKKRHSYVVDFPVFKNELEKKYVYIEPIKDTNTLTLIWELPAKFAHMQTTQPEQILAYILGYEGGKSLLAQLKREKLVNSLSSGGTKLGDDLMMFFIDIELTPDGLRDVDQVISRCFQAINNLQIKGIPPYLFEDIQKMATIQYQYQSKENLFEMLMRHASQIQDEDLSTYPEQTEVVQQFNPNDIQEFLKHLTPQNAQYLVMAPSKLTNIKPNLKEKWLNVDYSFKPISKDSLDKWKHAAPHDEIDLPLPNIFIPDNLKLVNENFTHLDRLVPEPITLINDEKCCVYFAQDDKFGVPKISWSFNILTPNISMNDPEKIALSEIYIKSITNLLDNISYPAKMAGLEYTITGQRNGLRINLDGYSQNVPSLLKEIFRTIKSYQPILADFQILKDSQMRKYHNFALEKPLDQSMEVLNSVIHKEFVTEKEKAAALRTVNFKRYTEYASKIFEKSYIQALLYGNLDEQQARIVVNDLKDTFGQGIYEKENWLPRDVIVLPQNEGPYYLESYTKAKGNAVLLAIENATFSHKERAAQQILMQALKEPFFSTLRTKQQTGYLVATSPEEIEKKLFNIFAVQSSTHDVRDLLSRFEQFIEGYVQEMGKTEALESQFKTIQEAMIAKYNQPAENILAMGGLLQTLAFDYDGDFDWLHMRLEAFRKLSYEDFLSLSKKSIGRENRRRLGILMKGEIPKENNFSYKRARTWNSIRKISAYEPRK